MSKFNFQSLFFAFVVLALSTISGLTYRVKELPPKNETVFMSPKQVIDIKFPSPTIRQNIVSNTELLKIAEQKSPENQLALALNQFEIPEIRTETALVEILTDSPIKIFEFNPNLQWPIASLTKLMTTIVAFEKIGKDKKIIIDENVINPKEEFNIFKNGDVFKAEDLIKSMLIASKNEAASALANFYKKDDFIIAMNEKAQKLEMDNTKFIEPTGLSPQNRSTVKDLEKLIKYIIKSYPNIFEISRQKDTIITEINSQTEIILNNTIKFAGQVDFIGGKTGYTDAAKENLISVFNYKNFPILIIVLGADDRFGETTLLYNRTKQLIDLALNINF